MIIGGRSSDSCVFAAPAIHHGFPENQAYYLGKVLECASFCAEPYGGKETVLGEVTADDVRGHGDASGAALHGGVGRRAMRCTSAPIRTSSTSRAARSTCRSAATSRSREKTTRITGAKFRRADEFRVKLEGAGKVGERYVGMVGIRDPYTIAHVDEVIAWARDKVRERFGETRLRAPLHRLRPRRHHGRARAAARPARARAVHPGAGRGADRGDGGGGLHDRHAADVLCAAAGGERLRGLGRVRARRGAAREPGVSLDAQPHAALRRSARAVPDAHDDGGRLKRRRDDQKLSELAKTIRSKNAGVDLITFDIIFTERATLRAGEARTRADARERAQLYRIAPERIADFVEFDPGNAIKFTIYRLRPSGSPGDPDIFGAQQYAPLLDIEVPGD